MDQIAEKLRQEIDSLEGNIQLAEETAILRHWVHSILEPLDRDGHQIPDTELNQVIEILQQARQQYNLDGELGDRLASLIDRHTSGADDGKRSADTTVQDPDSDPFDFLDEDDEEEVEEGTDEGASSGENGHAGANGTTKNHGENGTGDPAYAGHNDLSDEEDEGEDDDDYDGFVEFGKDAADEAGNRLVDFGKDEEGDATTSGPFDEENGDIAPAKTTRNGTADTQSERDLNSLGESDEDEYDSDDDLSGNRAVDFGKDDEGEKNLSGLFDEENGEGGTTDTRLGTHPSDLPDHRRDGGGDTDDDDDDYDSFIDFDKDDEDGQQSADFGKDDEGENNLSGLFDEENGEGGTTDTQSGTHPNDLSDHRRDGGGDTDDDDDDDYDDYGEEQDTGGDPNSLLADDKRAADNSSQNIDREALDYPPRGNTIAQRAEQTESDSQDKSRQRFSTEKDSKIRDGRASLSGSDASTVEVCAARVSLKDLLNNMDIQLPQQDLTQLNHALKNKFQSKPVIALQNNPASEGQYVLIPRISRFIHKGQLYSCTVKNMARTYFSLFADIKDLTQYKGAPFLNSETPQLGWAIVMREALTESLNMDFMQQNQSMRQLANAVNTPSHFVRRRSLSEAIYDLVVGRLVLNETFLTQTIDWTTSGPSKTEFVCTYYSEEGIRLRHLPRTQHNRALGVCPNW